jgi:8-oxo-dGTP pyrophosphatase MutT (NUDIX family)
MFVTPEVVAAAERTLGTPQAMAVECEILPTELANIRASQRDSRAHDVTTVLYCNREVLAIAKPSYPHGVYRIPGGALKPGEAMIVGAAREAKEETGLEFAPRTYVLRVAARFTCRDEFVDWTTHVVAGPTVRDNPSPVDTREVADAKWVDWQELVGPIAQRMLAAGRPLFGYRVDLHAAIYETMRKNGLLQVTPPTL